MDQKPSISNLMKILLRTKNIFDLLQYSVQMSVIISLITNTLYRTRDKESC